MSTTSRESPVVECHYPECESVGRKWEFRDGEYCSTSCEVRHAGWEALAPIRFDHTVCCTCFQQLKTVNPPKPAKYFVECGSGWTLDENGEPCLEVYRQDVTADAACGFQFLTEFAGKGELERSGRVTTGTICAYCGDTDHTYHYAPLADRAAIGRLVELLQDADEDVAPERLHRVYEREQELDLAVGEALED